MLHYVKKVMPQPLVRYANERKDERDLAKVERVPCDPAPLASLSTIDLNAVFHAAGAAREWPEVSREIAQLEISSKAGGVNHGDRRALYYLVRHLRPRSFLEVGTHVGASTVHIASAMKRSAGDAGFELTTVDIEDVNDPVARTWAARGSAHSPAEMVRRLGCEGSVEFRAENSLEYLARCNRKFDVVFLDGDHAAKQVYREIPAALKVLNPGGWILLHDYFPDLKPLWSNGMVVAGCVLAVQRLQSEGADFAVRPFGSLPWPTKLDSTVSSLALVGRP